MNKFSHKTLIALLCSLFIFASCIDENYTEEPQGLTDQPLLSNVIAEQSDLSTFNQLIDVAGLRGRLVGNRVQDQRAVFAPTNEAIANFLEANDFASANDVPNLADVVAFHIADANVQQGTLSQTNFTSIQTIGTKNISVTRTDGQILLNGQAVNILRSITEANGTVHVIDQVLVP